MDNTNQLINAEPMENNSASIVSSNESTTNIIKADYELVKTYDIRNTNIKLINNKKTFDETKMEPLKKAQEVLLEECKILCSDELIEKINTQIRYITNFKKTLVLDISDDTIIVSSEGKEYQFSKLRFLENKKHFQQYLREHYKSIFPNTTLQFFKGRDEGTFCIKIIKNQ